MSDLFPERLESERLRFVRFTRGDVDVRDAFERRSAAHSETAAAEFEHLAYEPHAVPKRTFDTLAGAERRWERGELAMYTIRPKSGEPNAGEPAGTTALIPYWEQQTAQLSIWLRKPFWGRGYAGERADRFLELAFVRLDLDLVVAACAVENERAHGAIEKYVARHGGQYEGVLRNWHPRADGSVADLHEYTVSAEQYAAARGVDDADGADGADGTDDGESPPD
ncbi:GNAT family N-acetyltransferase [Halospeciosus flavus]|uniref:GNAT family N-acetyltransferase n=1 Tax=Halospeciosus flavus TaxID=3032283 RepID=A0ABD5Z9H6_9EURY|nr:GNAT family protein [Halospeciosus flavus]